MLAVTLLLSVGLALGLLLLLGTPRVASAAGRLAGVGEPWITVWNAARWPALLLLAAALIALLYYFTPTVDRQTAPWFSAGAVLALAGWAVTTGGFWWYVTVLAHYGDLYGWAGGALVVLLWLFLSNLVLVLGAGLDAELTRLDQLRRGIHSESAIRMPMRDTTRNLLIARSLSRDEAEGRAIREESASRRRKDGPVAREGAGRRLSLMDERNSELPDERAVEQDFSIPADADYRTPAEADYTTPGDPISGEEHLEERDEEELTRRTATPGNPIEEN